MSTTLYYFEHYPHYSGMVDNVGLKLDFDEVDALHKMMTEQEGLNAQYELTVSEQREMGDWWEDRFEEMFKESFAFMEIFEKWEEVRSALKENGEWSDVWEEGSHALSTKSMKDAKHLVGLIEADIVQNEFEEELI